MAKIEIFSSPACTDLGPLPAGFEGLVAEPGSMGIARSFLDPVTGLPVSIPSNLGMSLLAGAGSAGPTVPVDIKPRSCPNPLNVKSKGVLPVAIVGTDAFDVAMIDPATVQLEGVAPIRWNLADVTTPIGPDAEECECNEEGPDGIYDLTLKFKTQEIVAALGDFEDEEIRPLTLTAETFEGVPIEVVDCVRILDKGRGQEMMQVPGPPG